MKIKYATISKTSRRSNNEDTFRVVDMPQQDRFMGIVCDGMGGHYCGEVASETVCNAISDFWNGHTGTPDCDSKVKLACRKASCEINRKADELNKAEIGTTMVMASIEKDNVTIAHVGDSRCYLLRPGDGLLYQTQDHVRLDFGWEVIAKCFFSYRPDVAVPDVRQFSLQKGDRLLLCSDGLYKSMKDDVLLTLMAEDKPLEEIINEYDKICETRGDDNYTATLIEVE